jgi:hypothetical protein
MDSMLQLLETVLRVSVVQIDQLSGQAAAAAAASEELSIKVRARDAVRMRFGVLCHAVVCFGVLCHAVLGVL